MPVGKDSIQKRVAKVAAPAEKVETPDANEGLTTTTEKATPAKTAPKKVAAPKKTTAPKTKKTTAPKAAPAPAAPARTEAPTTTVLGQVAPETVEKVIGHAESAPTEHIQIGTKMPHYLL